MPATPYVGQIMLCPYNFAPLGWVFCDGALLSIAQNNVLFNLIGTTYGGDGVNTFAVPDLRGRVPIHQGQGPGLSNYVLGQESGSENITLTTNQIPSHSHSLNEANANGNSKTPVGATMPANVSGSSTNIYSSGSSDSTMRANIIGDGGGGQPHNNIEPYLTINFCIALDGVFPSQN